MSESVSEQARTALLSALVGEAPTPPPHVRAEVVRLVTNPDHLLWDALWRSPQDCVLAALGFDLSEPELTAVLRYARTRVQAGALVSALGSTGPVRDRACRELLWASTAPGTFWLGRTGALREVLVSGKGRLSVCTALALWHLRDWDRHLVTLAAAALVACPDGVLEVLRTLALDEPVPPDPVYALERFARQVELGALLEDVPLPELVRFRSAAAARL